MASRQAQRKTVRLKLPVQDGDLDGLKIGSVVYLDGIIYTGREGAYMKLYEGLKAPALSRYGETDDRKDELI